MATKDGFSWVSVMIVIAFCLLASLGGGLSVQRALHASAGGVLIAYALGAGIFIAICAVILTEVLSYFKES